MVALELAVIFPVLIGFMFLAVLAGKTVRAHNDVEGAAGAAARAAVTARSAAEVGPLAAAAASAALGGTPENAGGKSCQNLTVSPVSVDATPGGRVTIRVSCDVPFSDLTGIGLTGARTLNVAATASATFDYYAQLGP
jgi:Flp pilus assembly protein TadG